ncbi:phage tail protein [Maritimibacter sp. HL-12]|uniref:phage tail protein n=1 Tax=Maritimibacter sp. HL-12 TaxID=1162418 RepID=UPI000A0EF41B|nr:phage tail protein [Maritimibacter sp. HL-12]SMH35740.1 hypothetical protein SAMN05661107_0641 [Maritimibacter sp. HL-12]
MLGDLVMMALGLFRFGASAPSHQIARRSSSWRWEPVPRLGVPEGLQYLGPGEDIITLEGVIYPHFSGGLRQVDRMRAMAGAAVPTPMMLVDGGGWVWGLWVIQNIEETKSFLMADGAPRKIEFTITLRAYHG